MQKPLASGFLFNLVGSIAPLVLAILIVPTYLATIGENRYGVLSLIWLTFGYFGLFDFGLSRATTNRLSALVHGEQQLMRRVYSSALRANFALGTLAAVIFYVVTPLFLPKEGFGEQTDAKYLLVIVAPLFPFALIGNVFAGYLEAHERFLTLNVCQSIGAVFMQTFPLLSVLLLGISLDNALLGATVARLLSIAILAAVAAPDFIELMKQPFDRVEIQGLLRYGFWVTITSGISPLLVSFDQFFIGRFIGTAELAVYSLAFSLATKALLIPGALTRALFPQLSRLDGPQALKRAQFSISSLGWVLSMVCSGGILGAYAFFSVWIDPSFAVRAAPVSEILLVGVWFNGVAFVPHSLLQGQRRADVVARFHMLESLPYLGLLILAGTQFGLIGVACAWVARVVLDFALLFRAAALGAPGFRSIIVPALVVIGSFLVAPRLHAADPLTLGLIATAIVLMGGVGLAKIRKLF